MTPSARGHGVGDAADRCVLDRARREQSRNTVFRCIKEQSEPAVRLYLRHGFTDAAPSPDDSGEIESTEVMLAVERTAP